MQPYAHTTTLPPIPVVAFRVSLPMFTVSPDCARSHCFIYVDLRDGPSHKIDRKTVLSEHAKSNSDLAEEEDTGGFPAGL